MPQPVSGLVLVVLFAGLVSSMSVVTAPAATACNPRPNVNVATTVNGDGRLRVTITAGTNEKKGGAINRSDPEGRLRLLDSNAAVYRDIVPRIAESLRASYGWSDVRAEIVSGAGHYLVEERPDEVADLIERHTGSRRR